MASSGGVKPLQRGDVEDLVEKGSAGRVLQAVHFKLTVDPDEEPDTTTASAHVVFSRSGGFMVVVPQHAAIRSTMDGWSEHGAPLAPGFFECTVAVETSRGRLIGEAQAELVDFPWGAASYFWKASSTRREVKVLGFEVLGAVGRPSKGSVYTAAEHWIGTGGMDDETAADYHTGEELEPALPDGESNPVDPEVVAALQSRIQELEQMIQPAQAVGASPKQIGGRVTLEVVVPHAKAPPLFSTPGRRSELTKGDWNKLQQLAGPPPPRVGRQETRRSAVPLPTAEQDDALLMEERDVEETGTLEDTQELQGAGALEQLLAAQLKQNHILLKNLVNQKSSDPVLGALSGSDNAAGSSSGVKGCIARDAFVKTLEDLPRVSRLMRQQALKELGLHPAQEDGSLMRTYMERRMCLADHKLLSYLAMMLSESWAVAFDHGDEVMMGCLAKMFFFVEQASIDNGRLQLAWLLTGMQEPPFHLLTNRRKQPGLQPFARLCPPAWVSGNLAYLRDLDYIEGRLHAMGKPVKLDVDGSLTEDPKPPKKQPKPPKGGRKGKASEDETTA